MRAINIEWDITDDDLTKEEQEDVLAELPTEVEIPDDLEDEDEISDWLSDEYGYCHNGFEIEEESYD